MPNVVPTLLVLPAEIRNKIYGYLWSDNAIVLNFTIRPRISPLRRTLKYSLERADYERIEAGSLIFSHRSCDARPTAQIGILGTCRQIYNEALGFFREKKYFHYIFWNNLPHHMRGWTGEWSHEGDKRVEDYHEFRYTDDGVVSEDRAFWHQNKAKKPEIIPLQSLAMLSDLCLDMDCNGFILVTPQVVARILRYFSVANCSLKWLHLTFQFQSNIPSELKSAHRIKSLYSRLEDYEPLLVQFCRDRSIAEEILSMRISVGVTIRVRGPERSIGASFEHFIRTVATTKGWSYFQLHDAVICCNDHRYLFWSWTLRARDYFSAKT